MIDLKDKLFHAIISDENLLLSQKLEWEKNTLERIFFTKKIMCRNSIRQKWDDNSFSKKNYNGDLYVSLSKHVSKQNKYIHKSKNRKCLANVSF